MHLPKSSNHDDTVESSSKALGLGILSFIAKFLRIAVRIILCVGAILCGEDIIRDTELMIEMIRGMARIYYFSHLFSHSFSKKKQSSQGMASQQSSLGVVAQDPTPSLPPSTASSLLS